MGSKKIFVFGVTALFFNNWLLGLIFNRPLLHAGGSISELSAATQPHHIVFQSLDILSGLLFLVCAYLLAANKTISWRRLFIGLTALTGIGQIIDALMAMPCSGTLDHSCNTPVTLNPSHFYIPPHAYSSTILGACFLLLPLAGLLVVGLRSIFGWISLATVAVTLVFFWFLFWASNSGYFLDSASVGFSQELQMLVFGLWFIYFASFSSGLFKPPSKRAKI